MGFRDSDLAGGPSKAGDHPARLLGRLRAVSEAKLYLAPDLENKLTHGDAWFAKFKKTMEDYARKIGMEGPDESEVEESVASEPKGSVPILELDLRAAGIIWAAAIVTTSAGSDSRLSMRRASLSIAEASHVAPATTFSD